VRQLQARLATWSDATKDDELVYAKVAEAAAVWEATHPPRAGS
jgi:hypothetical protein